MNDRLGTAARGAALVAILALAGCGGGGGGSGGGGGTPPPLSYTLGGTISGLGSHTGLVLANGGTTLSVAAGATSFSFPTALASGTTYAVSVQSAPSGLTCAVAGGTGTITANVSNVAVTCSGQSYTLGGTISGLGSHTGLVLANGGTTLSVAAGATSFSFPTALASGTTYAVSVQSAPSGLTCTVAGGTGTITANVSNVAVTCSGQSYTLGGTISGLGSGSGLVLTNEGVDPTTIPANATTFTMATAVPTGTAYDVAVASSPTAMSCSVISGAGTMPAANVTSVAITCGAGTLSIVYSLGTTGDGAKPYGSLIQASDGNLYGMTQIGGLNNLGTVIKVTPAGVESVLYSFAATGDGTNPQGSLIQASDGNFYGMTPNGGANGKGAVIKVTPSGTESVLYSFGSAGNGVSPYGSLLQANDGNLYGMTNGGGANGKGAVIKITLAGVESVLYSFAASGDGASPYGSLIQASDGNLYGMTTGGGANGKGAVIKVTLAGVESVLYSFAASGDGASPNGSLLQASDGNLYGMTANGGTNNAGVVFEVTLAGAESVLHVFGAAGDGAYPDGSLIQAKDGNLYGLTQLGGANNFGTLIKLNLTGTESVMHSFGATGDGSEPYSSLVQASNGSFYGMTVLGGSNNLGTVFQFD